MRKNQTKGLLGDIWRAVFGGGTGNTGAAAETAGRFPPTRFSQYFQ